MTPASAPAALTLVACLSCLAPAPLHADDPPAAPAPEQAARPDAEAIAAKASPSVVSISYLGRDGRPVGTGTGFFVSADGLVATNYHVIGEARPITVTTRDGTRLEVSAIHASDRELDLAVLKVDLDGAPALELAPPGSLAQGQPVLALGHPEGLEFSIVEGLVSALRPIGGIEMIQLAIPIERGNSGGPLLDGSGKVHGVLTLKSTVTQNLGFALPAAALTALLEDPNPIPIARWLTIGVVDPARWQPALGGRWIQRAGQLASDAPGTGFGGRSLLISQTHQPEPPYEVAVSVKLEEESGAAGLAFAADGGDLHLGFYPTAGKLRLTNFQGPDVYSWEILYDQPHPAYRPGDWNHLRARVAEDGQVTTWLNGEPAASHQLELAPHHHVGLAAFRGTRASFRNFRCAPDLSPQAIPDELQARLDQALATHLDQVPPHGITRPTAAPETLDLLAAAPEHAASLLADRARLLEAQATALRDLSAQLHHHHLTAQIVAELDRPDDGRSLARAALLLARLDNPDLDVEAYLQALQLLADQAGAGMPAAASPEEQLAHLLRFLFAEGGFHGARSHYNQRANRYLSTALDDREGLPITLAVLALDLARRLEIPGVCGVGLPGRFVLGQQLDPSADPALYDVFDGGRPLTRADASRLASATGIGLRPEHLLPATDREIILRMLRNTIPLIMAEGEAGPPAALPHVELALALDPDDAEQRLSRALLYLQLERPAEAILDLDWLIEHAPPGIDLHRLGLLRQQLETSP